MKNLLNQKIFQKNLFIFFLKKFIRLKDFFYSRKNHLQSSTIQLLLSIELKQTQITYRSKFPLIIIFLFSFRQARNRQSSLKFSPFVSTDIYSRFSSPSFVNRHFHGYTVLTRFAVSHPAIIDIEIRNSGYTCTAIVARSLIELFLPFYYLNLLSCCIGGSRRSACVLLQTTHPSPFSRKRICNVKIYLIQNCLIDMKKKRAFFNLFFTAVIFTRF